MNYDLAVIGAGPGGYTGAIRAAQLGLKTCIIEKYENLGGTCLNVGCIPSKALLDSSEHYEFALGKIKDHGVILNKVKLDLNTMMNRKNKVVQDLTGGIRFLMKKNKIDRLQGSAQIISSHEIQIDGKKTIQAKNILISTGSKPRDLSFAPFNKKTILSSTDVLCMDRVPQKLIVIGGGYIGLEMGSVWKRMGAEVFVIEYNSSICPSLDSEVSQALLKTLQKQGLQFELNSKVTKINENSKGVEVVFEQEGKNQTIKGDKVLVAIGRKPYTENLGLESVSIQTDAQGFIKVQDQFRTHVPHIFAVGDVIGGAMLAHKAEEEGVAVAEIIAKGHGHVNYKTLPSVIYTWPEVACVGLTEQQAQKEGFSIRKGKFPFTANGRAKSLGWTEGFVKIIADEKTDRILGASIIGPRASDMLAELVVAMEFSASSEDIARSFHAHPTLSETVREASLDVLKRVRQM